VRILLACPYAWDAAGGVQVHVRELGARLLARGHEVVALTPSGRRPREAWVRAVGRPVAVPYNRSVAPICFSPASAARIRSAIRSVAPDVVHAHEPLAPSTSMLALAAAASARIPVVATFHAGAERSLLFDLAAPALRPLARRVDVRIAVSRAAASFVERRLGDGFVLVPNGVDVERFARADPVELPTGRRVLFVGRLDERKGFRVAVAAFERLAERYPDLLLVAVGAGPEAAAVRDLPDAIARRVVLAGRVANEHLHRYEAAADVFVAPSVGGETFGVVLVEAMAAGVPVVASDIPGYDEVVDDGVDGLLVPARDPAALAAAVGRVLDEPELRRKLADAGRARARGYSWEAVTDRLEGIYAAAARRSPPGAVRGVR
jgi:phosphatidyl-myo-inositol alpha-mannosyltransferase